MCGLCNVLVCVYVGCVMRGCVYVILFVPATSFLFRRVRKIAKSDY